MSETASMATDYPLADSEATKILAAGLERLQRETGATQKEVATRLNYRTSVVLSHMALGRVPIPIDRANDIARELGLDPSRFLLATLKQRHPEVDFEALFGVQMRQESALASELSAIAGESLDQLPAPTKEILRDVVATRQPERRWLSSTELPIVEMIRQRYPNVRREGLGPDDRQQLVSCLGLASS